MSKKVLITGASGFVGHHLIEQLLLEDYEIVAAVYGGEIDDRNGRVTSIALNLTEKESINQVVETTKPDWIFHLAALSSPAASFSDDNKTVVNNIVAQANLLSAAVTYTPTARVLVVGSAEEYGKVSVENLPISESCPLRPMSPYAVSKVAQDFMGLQYFLSYGLPVIRVRPFNHVGEYQTDQFVLPRFAKQLALIEASKQDPILTVGNLEATRDFSDVKDMVRAYELAMIHGEPGEVYNLGSGNEVPVSRLLDILLSLSTADIKVKQDPARMQGSDVPRLCCDASRFTQLTGWKPEIPLESTVARVLDYWRAHVRST